MSLPNYPHFIATTYAPGTHDRPGVYDVDRQSIQDPFSEMLDYMGISLYGYLEDAASPLDVYIKEHGEEYAIDTPLFCLRPFYWGDNANIYRIPNFVYKPFDVSLSWYKYPLRDATTDAQLTHEDWDEIIRTCKSYYDALKAGTDFAFPTFDSRLTDLDRCAKRFDENIRALVQKNDDYYELLNDFVYGIQKGDIEGVRASVKRINEIVTCFDDDPTLTVLGISPTDTATHVLLSVDIDPDDTMF